MTVRYDSTVSASTLTSSTAFTKAAMMTGKISVLPDFLASCPTFSRLTPSLVKRDQLLCLPDPFAP